MKNIVDDKKLIEIRKKIHPLYLKLMNAVEKKQIIVVNKEKMDNLKKLYFDKNIPISFCANHTNSHDIPLAAKAIEKHFYVMIAKEGLTIVQKLAFLLNGPVFIKRDDKQSRKQAKEKLIKLHKNGCSTLVYPEAAWNVVSNKYMNKLYNGIVDVSKETNLDIVPLIFEYKDNNCYVKIGDPFKIDKNIESRKQSDDLRDIMVKMRVELLEEMGCLNPSKDILKKIEFLADNWDDLKTGKIEELISLRNQLVNLKETEKINYENQIEKNWLECPGLNKDFEASCVYKDEDSPDKAFEHLKLLKNNPKARFLFAEGISGYKE